MFQSANIIRRVYKPSAETLEAIHYHAYPPLWGVVGPLLMIDVVLCEELRSFVSKITTVRLNGLLAGGAYSTYHI